jgi:hypothetical protein
MSLWRKVAHLLNRQGTSGVAHVDLQGSRAIGYHRIGPFAAKTDAYTVKQSESGTIFTTRGATKHIVFTLPQKKAGLTYRFLNLVDYNMTIVPDTVHTLLTFNNTITAHSAAFSTTSEKKGAACEVLCDGTSWILWPLTKNTLTVATT